MSWHGFVTVGTVGTIGTSVACELVSWSFAGSGAARVVGTIGTIGSGDVVAAGLSYAGCILIVQVSW